MKYKIKLIIALCLILIGCATTKLSPVTHEGFKIEDDEKRLWFRSEEEQKILNKSGLIYRDEELEAYLNEIARILHPPEIFARIPFRVFVIRNHLLNAFAFPNGVIYIHSGILACMENEAQLATLLGHEMTHATHRHIVKGFRDMQNKAAALATFRVATSGLGGIGDLATLFGAVGTLAAVTGYSRELESEADTEGFNLIKKAGYDINEAPKLFIHMKKEVEEEKKREPFFFGSHPRLQERIDNYETFIETQKQKDGIKNTEVFLKKTYRVTLDNACLDLKAGRFKRAQKTAEKCLLTKADDAKAYYLMGEICRQRDEKGDREKSKEYYLKAISFDPSYPEPNKGIGFIHYKQGEYFLAKKYFETYLSISQNALDKLYIEEYIKKCNEGGDQQ